MSTVKYFDCDGVPVKVVDFLPTAFDVPEGRDFRVVPKPGSWDKEISKSAFEAMTAKFSAPSAQRD